MVEHALQPHVLEGFNRCRTAMLCRGLARMDFVPSRHVVSTMCTQFEAAPGPVSRLSATPRMLPGLPHSPSAGCSCAGRVACMPCLSADMPIPILCPPAELTALVTPAPTILALAVHSASRLAPDRCWAAQVVLVDCTTQIAALGTWGIGPQQLGQARSSRLLHMLHSTWSPQNLTVNYLAMEVRCLCPS